MSKETVQRINFGCSRQQGKQGGANSSRIFYFSHYFSFSTMEDDWTPILRKDCLFSSSALPSQERDDEFQLSHLSSEETEIKAEPAEDSDYHGSSSGSPSSSLSSPDMKVDNLGMDLTFCVPFHPNHNLLHSPSSSNGSPMFPPCGGGGPQTSPLPPVSHFSQQHNNNNNNQGMNQQQQQHTPTDQQSMLNGLFATHDTLSFFDDDRCSPSPPTSDRSSPMDNIPSIMMAAGSYEGPAFHASPLHNGVMMNGLSVAQQQLKSRSKMHEMAVKQRLITDQDPRSQGMVQLSAEERRTLIQEGFPVPTRLPLSKNEEEALKIVRRKIKNKLSAQESRRKRKEYMDTLEQRCQGYFSENTQLKGRVRQLEMSNKQLAAQLKKLQDMLGGGGAEH